MGPHQKTRIQLIPGAIFMVFIFTLFIAKEVKAQTYRHYGVYGNPCYNDGWCLYSEHWGHYACSTQGDHTYSVHSRTDDGCSKAPGYDYKGRRCNGGCDNAGGTRYSWCWVDTFWGWDYCGRVEEY